ALAVQGCDVLAELAVSGPFGSYLRRENDQYVLDLSWMLGYDTHDGLVKPGGRALFALRDGKLCTVAIERPEGRIAVDAAEYPQARAAMLAGMNEDLTTFRHNISTHLASLTPWAIATMNQLGPDHPLRRLLHHVFDTVLVGNREVAQFQLDGPDGFSANIFSHDAPVLAAMAGDYLRRFDFWNFEPQTHFERAGTAITPFAYSYRENVMRIWPITLEFATDYIRHYYADDAALRDDAEVGSWLREIDRLLTNGIKLPAGGTTREWLARLTATLIHHSSVEHDILNNVSWDYSTLSWLIPTTVPMTQRRAFDLIATLIGTWKPYNMLLTSNIPSLALDDRGRALMQRWIDRLAGVQQEMAAQPARSDWSYPAKWNPSISD
ncbi:MAG TPA: lipoxygenase family protein, partial [Thermoanaerobaculia bacterium]